MADITIPSIAKDIGNGRSTSFWHDPWVEDEEALVNLLTSHSNIIEGDSCVADWSVNGEWRLHELEGRLPDRVLAKIQASVPPSPRGPEDHCH